jgi:hypothetical protein
MHVLTYDSWCSFDCLDVRHEAGKSPRAPLSWPLPLQYAKREYRYSSERNSVPARVPAPAVVCATTRERRSGVGAVLSHVPT